MENIKVSISKDFSITPGPRSRSEGSFSAQEFLENIFMPRFKEVLQDQRKIIIDLDGTLGYGTSFLEQIFGGLAREYGVDKVLEKIEIISKEEPYLKDDILSYIEDVKKQPK